MELMHEITHFILLILLQHYTTNISANIKIVWRVAMGSLREIIVVSMQINFTGKK